MNNNLKSVSNDDLKQRIVSVVGKADFGLSNVDNTSDASKPVSSEQQIALNLKVNSSSVGVASGVASLDSGAKVPLAQIPNISVAGGQISDIQVVTPTAAQVLSYDGTKWTNTTASGGSANLAQNEIVIGVGEGTTNPQTVTLRGPTGTGTDVVPGDFIIQAPAGTGAMGSGKIQIQTATKPSTKPTILYSAGRSPSSGVAISSLSTSVIVPAGVTNCTVLAILTTSASATVNTFTFGGTAITILGSSSNASIGTYSIGYVQNVSAGTTTTLSATVSTSSMIDLNYILVEKAFTIGGFISQTITSGTTASIAVNGVLDNDLVLDFTFYKNTSNAILNVVPSPQVPILNLSDTFGGTPYKIWSVSGTYVPDGQTTVTMNQTYSAATTAFYCAFYIQRDRQSSSAAVTFTDALILDNGRFTVPSIENNFTKEVTDMTSTYVKVLTASSPRMQNITSTGTLTTPEARLLILPDAETLTAGHQIYVTTAMTDRTLHILPRMSSPEVLSISSFNSGTNNQFLLTGTTYIYRRTFTSTGIITLQSPNKYGGIWRLSNSYI